MMHFADRLLEACERKGAAVCVGLDPVLERLPAALRTPGSEPVAAIETFCTHVLDAVAPYVPCVKIQSACFERYGPAGGAACDRLIAAARERGLLVILDAKRGDIGISAAHYAAGCLADRADRPGPDALTVNAYLGADTLAPFVEVAAREGKGLFALVRTSNPGSDGLQSLALADGRTVADAVAALVAQAGSGQVGACGYSLLGAVVGATKAQDAARLRALMPQQIFLVPGFGAQGGGADDVRACFAADGRGAVITASRSVLYAYQKAAGPDWLSAVAAAAADLRQQIAALAGRPHKPTC